MRELNNVEIHATAGGILQRPLPIQVVINAVSLISGIVGTHLYYKNQSDKCVAVQNAMERSLVESWSRVKKYRKLYGDLPNES